MLPTLNLNLRVGLHLKVHEHYKDVRETYLKLLMVFFFFSPDIRINCCSTHLKVLACG